MTGNYGGDCWNYLPANFRMPVLYPDGTPAMPTKVRRAKQFLKEGKAIKVKNEFGIPCIQLKHFTSTTNQQKITLGIDPGKCYTGMAIQSLHCTLLGLHINLPMIENKKHARGKRKNKGFRIRSDIKENRMYEIEMADRLMDFYPINCIAVEVSKTKKPRNEWNQTIVGQNWQVQKLEKIAKTKPIDGVQTAAYRKFFNFYKQKKKKGEAKPETQVVDGIALASSGFLHYRKRRIYLSCRITPALFINIISRGNPRSKRNVLGISANNIKQVDYPNVLRAKPKNEVVVPEKNKT